MLTFEEAQRAVRLDHSTGQLFWRESNGRRVVAGARAGSLHKGTGYRVVGICGRKFKEHHVIWLLVTGFWPQGEIDHANRARDDNRPCNLRAASISENRMNTKRRRDNSSGFRGVYFHRQSGKYHASAEKDGRRISLGLYSSVEDAGAAACAARRSLFKEFAPSYDQ